MQRRLALIADDSKIFRACQIAILQEQGFDVVETDNGREALDLALSRRPSLLLLDALMPVLSGFQVIEKLREKLPSYQPTIFLVTAVYKSRRWEAEARKQYQVHEYLEKPLEEEVLIAALRRHFPAGGWLAPE
ncbi:MAG TPA: response regulator [Thermoanaerobaculaceae bacterium]|nr:response regulator [Thermoanaerobaculaceae bacterium]HRS15941.1 response regulator [Thermoanaerobaculaceae bacterium]